MGRAVTHFEVIGKDGKKLQDFYTDLFGWKIDANNPANYGIVQRDGNTNADGVGIGGGIAAGPTPDYAGHVTFYVEVPDVEAALTRAESLGGTRVFGPDKVPGTDVELGQFSDPEGHVIGLTRAAS
jgi:predicted enzyme related to lactoylglutathione lyase